MSQINHAISEIQKLDSMANEDRWVNQIHPLVKLFLTFLYITITVSFSKYDLTGVFGMIIYPLIVFNIGEISLKDALYRMRIVLPIVCIVGIWNPFWDREIVVTIGNIGISGGIISMLTLMIKGILTVLASYLLIATTTIERICYALRLLHVPKIMVTQILLVYRYITVLLAEARRITQAYELRAPGQKGIHFRVWGSLLGQLLMRSMDRADHIYESMCIRGYHGEFYYGDGSKCGVSDYLYLLLWSIVFVVFRLFPVLEMIGNLFV